MGIIRPLPGAVQSAVRSGFIVGGLTTVVEELIYNSLDAGATKVSTYVGVNDGYVKVEDDGCGIDRDGLVLLGERYATSKCRHFHDKDDGVEKFGFRGEVLCSIADISLIEIVTKVHGRANGYRKVMKGRKCLYLSIDNDREDAGTTVIVRDLFYNQPVRRRQMRSSAKKILHSVKKTAVRIALVQPRVSFKVVDMESEDELLRTHGCSSPLSVLCNNFGIEACGLHELSVSKGSLKLEGYVSGPFSSSPSKAVQYIYVNSRFVMNCPMHKVLNRLADMCWSQLSSDKGGKRGQRNPGPIYCLNLTCPCSSYDLSVEFSRTSVEFKDWAPVLMLFEESVTPLWSKRTKIGESSNCESDKIGNNVEEKIVGDTTSIGNDWLLRTCEISIKRRKIKSSEHEQASAVYSPYTMKMQVEDDGDLSLWQSRGVWSGNSGKDAGKCGEPKTKKAGGVSPSDGNFNVMDGTGVCLWEPDNGLMSFDENLSSSRWRDQLGVDDINAGNSEIGSWAFELSPERHKAIAGCKKLFLQDCSWGNLVPTPLRYDKSSISQVDNFIAKRTYSNSTGIGDVDGFSQFDIFMKTQRQIKEASGWSPKFNMESDMWNDLDITSIKCRDSLSSSKEYINGEHTSESLSELDGVCSSSGLSVDTDQVSAISYPFPSTKTWDLEHLIPCGAVERRSKARNCDSSFGKFNDDKDEFDRDRHSYENYSSTSCLNSYAGAEKGMWEFSPHGLSIDDINPIRYHDFSAKTFSPVLDRRARDYRSSPSVCWSASVSIEREVKMDVRKHQALEAEDNYGKRLGRNHHCCSPDGLYSGRCHDRLADEPFPPWLDFPRKLNTEELSICHAFPMFTHEVGKICRQRCQVPEPNFCFQKRSARSCIILRRSHSAPPLYRGKRRFLSVTNFLLSAAESPAVQTAPLVCNMTERGELEHSSVPLLFCTEQGQQRHEMTCTSPNVKGTSNNTQVSSWAQDDMTDTACYLPGYLKQVRDLESSQIKRREDLPDARLEIIAKKHRVGDLLNQVEDENTLLNIHSCMLHLAGDSLVPKSINRNCLERAKVLLQVDNKFIPVVASGTLAVIDQHAADERIRVEEMRQKVLSGEMKSITYLQEEKDLVLPEMAYQLLCSYAEHIQQWGWICNIFSQDSGSFAKNLDVLNAQPTHLTLLAVPCVLGVNLSDADLLEFLEQLADTDGSSTIPPSVHRVLNFKACRGAIMFGDKLLPSECSLIVEELKQTSLCFQCAHGRPTTVPLVNLDALHKGITQLRSDQIVPHDSWHGLSRKEISIARAKHRLDMARGGG